MKPSACSSSSIFISRAATLITSKPTQLSTPSSSPWISTPGNPLLPWPTTPPPPPAPPTPQNPNPKNPNEDQDLDLPAKITNLLRSAHPPPFSAAWDLLLSSPSPPSLPSFLPLIRRYARAHLPSSALRTLSFYLSRSKNPNPEHPEPFELLLDALVKEGLTNHASAYFLRKKSAQPDWSPSARCYNILLHGWFRSRNLKRAERLWVEMKRDGVEPSVVTYGTLVEGLCRMRRPDQAMELLEEMRRDHREMEANHFVLNPIVDSLAEAGRFKEALGFVERFPVLGVSPNISTYNSLVKGFVKNGDVVGGSRMLKVMIGREILPTATTYNYFFR